MALGISPLGFAPLGVETKTASGPSGTFAATLDGITLASSGAVTDVGAFASTLGGISMAANGVVADAGAFSSTLSGFTFAASGIAGTNATGSFAALLDGMTMMATGQSDTPIVMFGAIMRRRARPRIPPKS